MTSHNICDTIGLVRGICRLQTINYFLGVSPECSKTRPLPAKIAAQNLLSLQVNKNSSQKKALLTSHNAAKLAATTKNAIVHLVKCSQQSAQDAVAKRKFLSSHTKIALYIAVIASRSNKGNIIHIILNKTPLVCKNERSFLYINRQIDYMLYFFIYFLQKTIAIKFNVWYNDHSIYVVNL